MGAWYVFVKYELFIPCDKWVPVTMAWKIAVNILNKQAWTADKWWSYSLEFGQGATTPHYANVSLL
jgi:hypothetical protein